MAEIFNLEKHCKKYADKWCKDRKGKCDRIKFTQEGYEDRSLHMSDITFDYDKNSTPEISFNRIYSTEYINNGSEKQTTSISEKKSTTETSSLKLSAGLQLGLELSVKEKLEAKLELISGSVETGVTLKIGVNLAVEKTSTTSENKEWQVNFPLVIPPHTKSVAEFLVEERNYKFTIYSTFILSGWICSNSPSKIDGHYFWFHRISDIFKEMPHPDFKVIGDEVHYKGAGFINANLGAKIIADVKEYPLSNLQNLQNEYKVDLT